MSIRKLHGSWWADVAVRGERRRQRAPVQTIEGARAFEAELRAHLLRRPVPRSSSRDSRTTLASFAPEWMTTYVRTNNKPSEIQTKESTLRNHLLPYFGRYELGQIRARDIEQYKAKKLVEGQSPKSVNNHLAVLQKCLRCAVEWDCLLSVPPIRKLRCPDPKIDFLTEDEVGMLLSWDGDQMWAAMVRLALRAGMRQGELLALHWSDVDLTSRTVTVRWSNYKGIVTSPKNGRTRLLPLADDAANALAALARKGELVFTRTGSAPLTYKAAECALDRVTKAVGLRHIGWHTLRHTCATHLVGRGAPIRVVQVLLGHQSVTMTERYAQVALPALHDAVRMFGEPSPTSHIPFSGQQNVGNTTF